MPIPFVYRGHEDAGFFYHAITIGGREDLIEIVADNRPPSSGGYVCVVPVLDFWRLHPGHCEDAGVAHFATAIEAQILSDARAGRALLLFDLCNEGPPFDSTLFDFVHDYLDSHMIPAGQAVWLAQNRAVERSYRAHYARARDAFVSFEYYDFFVKMIAAKLADESSASLIGNRAHLALRIRNGDRVAMKDRIVLCLNATPRPHRVLAIAALIHHKLFEDALVSFPGLNYEKAPTDLNQVLRHLDLHQGLGYLKDSCLAVARMPPLRVDDFTRRGNKLFDLIDPKPYERTFFSLVTETEISDGTVARITEKAIKAYSMGHPCHILGNPRCVEQLSALGFSSFGALMDLAYEQIDDPVERFNALFRSVRQEVASVKDDPSGWHWRMSEIAAANIQHAFSGRFLRRYVTQYDEPTVSALRNRLSRVGSA